MPDRITEIQFPELIRDHFLSDDNEHWLRGIKRLNSFVGPNNCGKSRLLRSLFTLGPNLRISIDNSMAKDARVRLQEARSIFAEMDKKPVTGYEQNAKKFLGEALDIGANWFGTQLCEHTPEQFENLPDAKKFVHAFQQARATISQLQSPATSQVTKILQLLEASKESQNRFHVQFEPPSGIRKKAISSFGNAKYVYIPTLRGMRLSMHGEQHSSAYFDRTWHDYLRGFQKDNITSVADARTEYGMNGRWQVITGLEFYQQIQSRLLGSLSDRTFVRKFEEFISKHFFNDRPVALIPRHNDVSVHIKIGGEKERAIQWLGDGLQQVLILTWPLFAYQDKPLFLFIEEPDLFLHPGYQRVLIDTILDNKERSLYAFVTTHSTQFLDITISEEDTAIFRCEKQPPPTSEDLGDAEHDSKFSVKNVARDDSLLKHIGVLPSSVMLANCSIWVEGVTDRKYYARFIELAADRREHNIIEDLHYTFVEYSGGNIEHWSFLDEDGIDVARVCAKLFLVADKDKGKDARHEKLEKSLSPRFHRLPVLEVENLLTPSTIKAVIQSYEKDSEFPMKEFEQKDYTDKPLGTFINESVLIDKSKSNRKGTLETYYADKSGTVKDKAKFCEKALHAIKTYDDLSPHAKELANKVIDFIIKQNEPIFDTNGTEQSTIS